MLDGTVKFVPQWQDEAGGWHEYIIYDKDSPYLHPKVCDNPQDAWYFLTGPTAIYNPGEHGCTVYDTSNLPLPDESERA